MSATTMSSITSLSVSSSGVIKFRWEGVADTLSPSNANAYVRGTVTGPGAQPTNGGQPLNLKDWTAAVVPVRTSSGNPIFEVILTPPASPTVTFQTGLSVVGTFYLKTKQGGQNAVAFPATTMVDAPFGQVVSAISGPTGVKQDLDLLTGFPLQVYDSQSMPPGGGGGGGASATPTARAAIDAQMKAVLGRSTGTGGVAGTLAALDRSFQPVVSGGVDTWVWQPQSYAVQSDIGAGVTGEQASLARLAATVGDEILPLITGLTPLVPEATVNPDEIAAAQSIIAEAWPTLTTELGSDAGPRIPRAKTLLADSATQLVRLGILLGMYESGTSLNPALNTNVNFNPVAFTTNPLMTGNWPAPNRGNGVVTGDDEADYTNFIISCDRVQLVCHQFGKLYLKPPGTVPTNEDRGFLVTVLQRALDASGEAADAVYAALDSVNLGRDEREVIYVANTDPSNLDPTYTGPGSLSIEDILSWAADFPRQEASSLLQNGGNVGVQSILNRIVDIQKAVAKLMAFAPSGPPGLGHPRVTYALTVLADALGDVITYASKGGLGYTEAVTP